MNEPVDAASAQGGETTEVSVRLVCCVEALLMAADEPLSIEQLMRLLAPVDSLERADIETALFALAARYTDAAVDLVEVAGGWRFQVGADYGDLVARLWEERPPKLSRALLETLAIICYRQPLARSEIEAVRGVSVSTGIIRTLTDHGWIRVVGHREVPGRPALYATSQQFLDDFNVKRLTDLPSLPELKDAAAVDELVARLRGESGETADTQASAGDSDTTVKPEENDSAALE